MDVQFSTKFRRLFSHALPPLILGRDRLLNVALSAAAVLTALVLLEGGLRAWALIGSANQASIDKTDRSLYVMTDLPYLYGLNPEHSLVSQQGLRDREFVVPKPDGVHRILVLGDSVTYGVFVDAHESFPKQLERRLQHLRNPRIEVVNAGVAGYTTYTELQYYLHRGRTFGADTVVVAFVMNDVVNPRRHVNYPGTIPHIPEDAIPNLEYDRKHVLPKLQPKLKGKRGLLDNSRLYRFVKKRWELLRLSGDGTNSGPDQRHTVVGGKKWPIFIAGEDVLNIKVLLDYESAEWRWLRRMYTRLNQAVRDEGAQLIVTIVPLSYQLDPEYPFSPQKLIERFCRENGIPCLDLLPAFQQSGAVKKLYLDSDTVGSDDIWHLSPEGHALAAQELETFLAARRLGPDVPQPPAGSLTD